MLTEKLEIKQNSMNQAEANIGILINRLEEDLRQKVFSVEMIELIEKKRFMTDLRSLSKDRVQ